MDDDVFILLVLAGGYFITVAMLVAIVTGWRAIEDIRAAMYHLLRCWIKGL